MSNSASEIQYFIQRDVDFIQAFNLSIISIHLAVPVSQHTSDSRGSEKLSQGKHLLFQVQLGPSVTLRVSSVKQLGQRSMVLPVHKISAIVWRKRSA